MAGLDGLGKENLKTVLEIKNAIADVKSAIASTNKEFKAMGLAAINVGSEMGKITSSANQFAQLQDQAARSSKATSDAIKQETKQLGIVRSLNIEINDLASRSLSANDEQAKVYRAQAQQLTYVRDNAQDLASEFSKLAKSSADIDGKTVWFTAFSDFLKDIPGLRMLSGPFEAAAKASRETVINNAKANDIQGRIGDLVKSDSKINLKTGKGLTKAKLKEMNLTDITGKKSGAAAAKLLRNAKATAKTQSVGFSGMKAGAKALGPAMKAAFGPLAIITTVVSAIKAIIKMMGAASAQTAKFSNNLLVGRESARELRDATFDTVNNYNEIAREAGEVTITQEGLAKTMDAINQKLGFQINVLQDFGDEMGANVAEAAMLQQNFGLSAEASSQLFLESVKTGKPLKEMTKEMFGQLGLLSSQEGLTADITGTIEAAAKVSGNLRANFGASTAAIAAGIFNAKRLGFELSSMEGVSSSLLDFQSSIENEMQAELLIGKELNLEKAREAALMGDTETLMKEISAQAGSQEDFLKMNIIQRKALASAVGMEVNELADMYDKRAKNDALAKQNLEKVNQLKAAGLKIDDENFNLKEASLQEIRIAAEAAGKSEAELREILGDQIYLRKQEESAQQKFNKAIAQAKEAFASLVDGGALDSLADILTGLTESALFAGFKEEGEAKRIAKAAEDKNASQTDKNIAAEAVEATSQATGVDDATDVAGGALTGAATGALIGSFFPVVGTAIGGILGGLIGGGTAALKNMSDQSYADKKLAQAKDLDLVDFEKADDFIIRPGQKPIKFNKGDLVMGGTNLEGSNSGEVSALLKELISAVREGGDVFMDGNKVGKSLALATSKMG